MATPIETAASAAANVLTHAWPVVATDVAAAIQRSLVRVQSIETLFRRGELTGESREFLLATEEKTIRTVIRSFEIVAIETAQAAANAAIQSLVTTIADAAAPG